MLCPSYKSNEPPRAPLLQKYLRWIMAGAWTLLAVVLAVVIHAALRPTGALPSQPARPIRKPAASSRQVLAEALIGMVPASAPKPAAPPFRLTPKLEAHCRDLIHSYEAAATWREKLSLIRNASRVSPLLQAYYERDHLSDPPMREPLNFDAQSVNSRPVVRGLFASARAGLGVPVEIALAPDHDGEFRIDWESLVGAGEMSWPAFQAQRPTQPTLLRGFAKADTYFNFEFADAAKYRSFRIYSPDEALSINAFCAKDSPSAPNVNLLPNLDSPSFLLPVTVRLAYPPQAKSEHCAALVEVVAKGWLLP